MEILLTHGLVLRCIQEITMSRRSRRNHLPAFKAKVALEVAKEEMTISELAQKYDISPSQIIDRKR